MEDTRPVCDWKLDENGLTSDVGEPPGGCRLPPGFKGWVFHEAPDAWQEVAPRAKLHARPHHRAAKKEPVVEEIQQPVAAPAPVAVPATKAVVAVPPPPSADDLSRIAANAGGGVNGILLALIAAVGGGGAIWKYLQSKQKAASKKDEQEHEERMKELELQRDAQQQKNDDHHKACDAARATLAGRVESLEGQGRLAEQTIAALRDRLDAVAAKAESAGGSEEALATLSKRVSKLETAVKAKKGAR